MDTSPSSVIQNTRTMSKWPTGGSNSASLHRLNKQQPSVPHWLVWVSCSKDINVIIHLKEYQTPGLPLNYALSCVFKEPGNWTQCRQRSPSYCWRAQSHITREMVRPINLFFFSLLKLLLRPVNKLNFIGFLSVFQSSLWCYWGASDKIALAVKYCTINFGL